MDFCHGLLFPCAHKPSEGIASTYQTSKYINFMVDDDIIFESVAKSLSDDDSYGDIGNNNKRARKEYEKVDHVDTAQTTSKSIASANNAAASHRIMSPGKSVLVSEKISSSERGKNPSMSSSSSNNKKKRVSFGTLSVRRYDMILGDHPDCTVGPPVQLGWEFHTVPDIPLEIWENYRSPPRHKEELLLHWRHRRDIALNAGASKQQILESMKFAAQVRNQRFDSSGIAINGYFIIHGLPITQQQKRKQAELVRQKLRHQHLTGNRQASQNSTPVAPVAGSAIAKNLPVVSANGKKACPLTQVRSSHCLCVQK